VALEWEKNINIYLPKKSDSDCSIVYPVSRKILNAETLAPGSLEALFLGITEEEKKNGYITSIPEGVLVQKFEIQDKTAYVDVSSEFASGIKNKCRKEAVDAQIINTLSNLSDIDKVVLSIDGELYMQSN
jgi:spore germination protein GerM